MVLISVLKIEEQKFRQQEIDSIENFGTFQLLIESVKGRFASMIRENLKGSESSLCFHVL